MASSRHLWFVAERAAAQGGGLLFTAVLARVAAPQEAAGFVAAYALASVFQPLFANACQPLAIRLWREAGPGGALTLWLGLQATAAAAFGAAALWGQPMLAVFLIILAAPLSLISAPLIAEDRWPEVMSVLVPVGLTGAAARIAALILGDLTLAAGLFAFEPVAGGLLLARRSGLFRAPPVAIGKSIFLGAAPTLMAAMGATTLFWRAPVLLAEGALSAPDVLRVAFAAQIVAGCLMIPNAATQAEFGRIAAGGAARRAGIAVAARTSLAFGVVVILASHLAGEALLTAIYGPAATGGGAILTAFAPLALLGGIWRLTEFLAAHDGAEGALLASRAVALGGMGAVALANSADPSPVTIGLGASLSLALSAIVPPLVSPPLRRGAAEIAAALTGVGRKSLKV